MTMGNFVERMTKDLSYTLLGTRVDALTIPELNALVAETIERGEQRIIANHNLHSIYLYHHDPKMRAFYAQASYTRGWNGPSLSWPDFGPSLGP